MINEKINIESIQGSEQNMDNRSIGMFDSGVGGLTVLKEVQKELPQENIIYLGDTKRFPYGSKSKESIVQLTQKGMDFLISQDVKAIVIACGTATSQALEEMQKRYRIPIMGIIDSTVQYIEQKKNLKTVGVIATAGTIRSRGWEKKLKEQITGIEVKSKACPLLAPMAEEGWINNEIARLTIQEYLKDMKEVDALILGCTHYPLFEPLIKEELGSAVEIIHTGKLVSKQLKELLFQSEEEGNASPTNTQIYLTDRETNFIQVASILLENKEIAKQIKEIQI